MRRDSRLSVALHALLHMAESPRPLTSDEMAGQMQTNAVVIRRTMAGLRAAGIVSAKKGHGGGWAFERRLDEVTLADVYDALGMPAVFAMGNRTESPGCLVEQAVNRAMDEAFDAAAAILGQRLRGVTLADLAADVRRRGGLKHRRGAKEHA